MKTLEEVLKEKKEEEIRKEELQKQKEEQYQQRKREYSASNEFKQSVRENIERILPDLEAKVKRVSKFSSSYDLRYTSLTQTYYYNSFYAKEISEGIVEKLCKLGYKAKLYVNSGSLYVSECEYKGYTDYGVEVDLTPIKEIINV